MDLESLYRIQSEKKIAGKRLGAVLRRFNIMRIITERKRRQTSSICSDILQREVERLAFPVEDDMSVGYLGGPCWLVPKSNVKGRITIIKVYRGSFLFY